MKKLYNNCLFFDKYRDFSITFCSLIFMVFLLISIAIVVFYKLNFCISYSGFVVKEDDYYVSLYIDDNGLQNIKKNVLVVNKVNLDFDIVRISDDYVLTENGPMRCVYLKFNLDDGDKIINNVLKLNFIHKSTIFNKMKEMFK